MRLQNEIELENTKRKLKSLTQLILKKEEAATPGPAADWSLNSMRQLACRLQLEIDEFQRSHQVA